MVITGKTLLHLNYTRYYDDEGYNHYSLEDARNESLDKTNTTTIRKQNCYLKEWNELNVWEKEQAKDCASYWHPNSKPEEFMYLFGATHDNLLFMNNRIEFQKDLNNGTLSVVERKLKIRH